MSFGLLINFFTIIIGVVLNRIVLMDNAMTDTAIFHNDSTTGAVTNKYTQKNCNYWTKIMQDTWFYEESLSGRIKGRARLWKNNIKQLKELKKRENSRHVHHRIPFFRSWTWKRNLKCHWVFWCRVHAASSLCTPWWCCRLVLFSTTSQP